MIRINNINKTNKSAASIMWVKMWIKVITKADYLTEIDAEKKEDGTWLCEFVLPVINKKYSFVSSSHIDSVKNACDEAAKDINEYMEQHPEIEIHNIFREEDWVYYEDLDTNTLIVTKSDKARKEGWGW